MFKPTKQALNFSFLIIFTMSFAFHAIAQDIERIEVFGKIIVDSPDLEGVTVFNKTSNKGTVTDKEGKFHILVALNDIVEISALQFQDFQVSITQDILDSKALTVVLVEEVNKLPEVIILPYGLTGNLTVDAIRAKTVNPNLDAVYFGLDNLDKIDFTEDYLTGVRNTAMSDNKLYYTADAIKIIGLLVKPLFNAKNKKKEVEHFATDKDIIEKYSPEYLMEKLNIPKSQMMEFIYYVEDSGMDKSLLEDGHELQFLEYVIKKSKEFQAKKNGKN
jgi:hypothetical protein